jgi:hypothetical protein
VLERSATAEEEAGLDQAVAEQRHERRQQGHREGHRDQHDDDRAPGQPAEDRRRHEQHAGERDHHGEPAEEHGPVGRCSRHPDRFEVVPPALSLLAIARHDEQGVIDPDGETHHRDQVRDEEAPSPDLSEQTDDAEGHADREDPHDDRGDAGDQRAEDDQQDDDRHDDADRLALLEVVFGDLLEVGGRGRLTEHVEVGAARRVLGLDRVERSDEGRGLVAVLDEDHAEQDRAPVLRRERAERGGLRVGLVLLRQRVLRRHLHDHARVDRADVVQGAVDLRDERRIGRRARGPRHHEGLRRDVLLEPLLLQQRLRPDRLRVVREVEVGRERVAEQRPRRSEAYDEDHRPDHDGSPGVTAARSCECFRIDLHRSPLDPPERP